MRILQHKKTAKRKNQIRHERNVERLKMRITKGDTVRGDARRRPWEGRAKVLEVFFARRVASRSTRREHRQAASPKPAGCGSTRVASAEMPAPVHVSRT